MKANSRQPAPDQLRDRGWLYTERKEKRRSLQSIADELHTPLGTVFNWCKRHGFSGTAGAYLTGQRSREGLDVAEAIVHRREEDLANGAPYSVPLLIARVSGVVDALRENDQTCLRAALIDLAALVCAWADAVPRPSPTAPFVS